MKLHHTGAIALLALVGGTSIKVKPVASELQLQHVCIHLNPAVRVDDFVMLMREGIERHSITAEI